MTQAFEHEHESDTALKTRIEPPVHFHVILNNDDYTPMEFVVEVLQNFFFHNKEQAEKIMLDIHHKGKGICGTYSAEIAEAKVTQVKEYAGEHEHPLLCTMERAD